MIEFLTLSLKGLTPPLEGASDEETLQHAEKFMNKSRSLAVDGYIVYDIQDEEGRTEMARPFPFRKLGDPAAFATVLERVSGGRASVVYKCVAESDKASFNEWLSHAVEKSKNMCFNFVGGATHSKEYKGPTIPDAADLLTKQLKGHFGGVTIAERHEKKGNEHETLLKKQSLGAEWFITQAIYDQQPTIKLINDYGKLCKERNVKPVKIILTFAPCGREKTMNFIKWLGVRVPEWVEQRIFSEDATPAKTPLNKSPVERSVDILCDMCEDILEQTKDSGVPLGVSVESVSIFKNEVEAAHELFRRCQHIALDFFKRPWRVNVELIDDKNRKTNDAKKKTNVAKTTEGGVLGENSTRNINPLITTLAAVVGLLVGRLAKS
jgi:hypothetical protein